MIDPVGQVVTVYPSFTSCNISRLCMAETILVYLWILHKKTSECPTLTSIVGFTSIVTIKKSFLYTKMLITRIRTKALFVESI